MAEEQLVTYECRDGIAQITLNRPEKRNALSDESVLQLHEILLDFAESPDARVAVLRGAGRAFCSGIDVRQREERAALQAEGRRSGPAHGARVRDVFFGWHSYKPVIAAVHGYALGAGLVLTLLCDLVVSGEETRFQVTETVRGLDGSELWRLLVARGAGTFADEVALTGRFFSAEEACTHGVINQVVQTGRHVEGALELAALIAANPEGAVAEVVRARRFAFERIELDHRSLGARNPDQSSEFRASAQSFLRQAESS
jgi:enoyl-CoA hydratase/carnithine racemase